MIKLNENGTVRFAGIKSEMLAIRTLVEQVFNYYGYALVITAGTEEFDENGKLYHKIGSKHPKGEAEDYRTLGIPTPVADMVYLQRCRKRPDTGIPGCQAHKGKKAHMHIEFDPQTSPIAHKP